VGVIFSAAAVIQVVNPIVTKNIGGPNVRFIRGRVKNGLLPDPGSLEVGRCRVGKKPLSIFPRLTGRKRILLGNSKKVPLPALITNEIVIVEIP
jgi:hypothetical protein